MILFSCKGVLLNTAQNKEFFIQRGEKEREISNFHKAIDYYKKAKKIGKSIEAEIGIAHCMRVTGNFRNALNLYEEILKKYKKNQIVADALLGKALCLKGLSKTKSALFYLKKAEKIYEKINDEIGFANLYWAYSVVLRISADFLNALQFGEKALSMFNYYNDKKGILYTKCALGGLNRILGNLNDSFEYYKSANEISKKIKDKFGTAYSYCGIGNYYRMVLDFENAMTYFQEAERIYKKINDIVSYSYTLWSMGVLKTFEKNFKEANSYLKRALDNFKKTEDKRGMVYCLIGLIQLKYIKKENYSIEIKNCKDIFKKYNLKWENLLFEILQSKIKGKEKDFLKRISAFGVSYKFDKFPINFP